MFDEIRFRLEDAGDEHHVVGHLHVVEKRVFVGMARVGGFERNTADISLEGDVDDVGQWHVAMVRAFVVPPAKMNANHVLRHVCKCVVQRLDMQLRTFAEIL